MGKITHLVIHCTGTPEGHPDHNAESTFDYHHRVKGWKHKGYHRVIEYDGRIVKGQDLDADDWISPWEVANGARGINQHAVHIAYVGGMSADMTKPKDTRTPAQKKALEDIVRWSLKNWPGIKVICHNEISNKACPSFDVQEWLLEVGLLRD